MRAMLKFCWAVFCIIAGAAIGGGLAGLRFRSWGWAIAGGVVGGVAGWGFSRLVSPVDFLMHAFD